MASTHLLVWLAIVACANADEGYFSSPGVQLIVEGGEPMDSMMEVAQPPQPEVRITRECFQRSCTYAYGHEECTLGHFACAPAQAMPHRWHVLPHPTTGQEQLVSLKAMTPPGLIKVVQEKKVINPHGIITMPGVPAKAPPALAAEMKRQDTLLHKVITMEEREVKMDPLHKKARTHWLHLAKTIVHMPAGPMKLKQEGLLMMLAKNLAAREIKERQLTSKMKVEKKMEAKQAKKNAHKVNKAKKALASAQAKKKKAVKPKKTAKPMAKKKKKQAKMLSGESVKKFLHGLPVSHNKCYERACIKREADGKCGAAVISCGRNGKKPKNISKLSRKEALKKVGHLMKKVVGPMMKAEKNAPPAVDPGKTVEQIAKEELHDAGKVAYNAQSMLFQESLNENLLQEEVAPSQDLTQEEKMVERLRENGEIAQEEAEELFQESLRG